MGLRSPLQQLPLRPQADPENRPVMVRATLDEGGIQIPLGILHERTSDVPGGARRPPRTLVRETIDHLRGSPGRPDPVQQVAILRISHSALRETVDGTVLCKQQPLRGLEARQVEGDVVKDLARRGYGDDFILLYAVHVVPAGGEYQSFRG